MFQSGERKEAEMFGAGQQVVTPDGAVGRVLALAGEHVSRRMYVGDICVPASVVLLDSGEMRWFADSDLQPLTQVHTNASEARFST
jgi:hypothetical protein